MDDPRLTPARPDHAAKYLDAHRRLQTDSRAKLYRSTGRHSASRGLQHHLCAAHRARPRRAVSPGTNAIQFIVAGYDQGSRVGELFECNLPGPAPLAAVRTSNNAGPWWIGQNDVAGRVFNGFDGRIQNLPFVQAAHQAGQAFPQLQQLMYIVHWHTMTLQDTPSTSSRV